MEKEEKIKVLDNLIKDEQEAIDVYHKAIDKLKGDVHPSVIEELGEIYNEEVRHIAKLETIKKRIETTGLGDPIVDNIFFGNRIL